MNVPHLKRVARRLLQAVSRATLRRRHAADAVGRAGGRRDALRPRKARDARRVPAAQPVSRQEDDQRPDVRAVLLWPELTLSSRAGLARRAIPQFGYTIVHSMIRRSSGR